uniref:Uncharacterized protein n=1 Tax=Kalanchoe fedtschenkoi TaxID=63787 RepID=A0A7N0ZSY9_KALFE
MINDSFRYEQIVADFYAASTPWGKKARQYQSRSWTDTKYLPSSLFSESFLSCPPNMGWSSMFPNTSTFDSAALIATWWAMFPPELSPAKYTLTFESLPLCSHCLEMTHFSAAQPSSYAAGYLCSGDLR